MADTDLVFIAAPLTKGDLVFGDDGSNPISDATISGDIDVGQPTLQAHVVLGVVANAELDAGMPVLSGEVKYFTDTQRPIVAMAAVRWQDAESQSERAEQHWADSQRLPQALSVVYEDAIARPSGTEIAWSEANRQQRQGLRVRYQDGSGRHTGVRQAFFDAIRTPNSSRQRYQVGVPVSRAMRQRFQDGIRGLAGQHRTRYQDGVDYATSVWSVVGSGKPIGRGWGTKYQDAIPPRPGRTVLHPVDPPVDSCYIPSADLLFEAPWSSDTNLVFVCEKHGPGPDPEPGETVVVPVRRIYTVINSAMLRRVDGDVLIPNTTMSLTIDVDSWTWGFSARVPGAALPDLEPVGGEPVEVEATINGIPYRAIVEGISRERVFGRSDLTITGRGKAAVLDSPYSAFLTFGNPTNDRTVQQLANDVLSLNGVSLGWDVDAGWKPDDWLVPAGAWSFQGSHMAALNAIAAAAGAYVQPHRTDKALSVLRRYPAKPWEWGDVTPDFELPSDVVQKEGVTWSDKAVYNRVFVRGMKSGILGQATRLGTAGDLEAPMVTDQLITNAIGARQRALPVLADVGRQAAVSLRLPVLAETGIIPPGKFVRYVDAGVTRIGLVRSVSAEVQRADKKLTIWQTIGVETHVSV